MGYSRFGAVQVPGLVISGSQRATLVRRTYAVVLGCVLVTMGGTWLGLQNESLMIATAQHPIITMLVSLVPLWVASAARSMAPAQRLGLVTLFALMMGVAISPAIFYYSRIAPGIIGQAALLTGSSFAVLTTYAFLSRRDFSAWGSFFTVGLWVLIGTSLLNLWFKNETAHLWLAGGTVLVFSGLLIYDTWRLKNAFGPDEYIMAAVRIYLDVLNMFMAILTLLGGGRRSN
jgi:FtsH-binding integral membrane protein